jgi:hypothetical protein
MPPWKKRKKSWVQPSTPGVRKPKGPNLFAWLPQEPAKSAVDPGDHFLIDFFEEFMDF